jgi:hypothetical protein
VGAMMQMQIEFFSLDSASLRRNAVKWQLWVTSHPFYRNQGCSGRALSKMIISTDFLRVGNSPPRQRKTRAVSWWALKTLFKH